jgi:hypothetical protein
VGHCVFKHKKASRTAGFFISNCGELKTEDEIHQFFDISVSDAR